MVRQATTTLTVAAPARLEVRCIGQHRLVRLNGHEVACYPVEDVGTERVLLTQLSEVLPIRDRDVAAAFGIHPGSLSRLRGQVRSGGAPALMPRRPGPKKASKLTPELLARIVLLKEKEGLSTRRIAKRLSRANRVISHQSVARALRAQSEAPEPQPLPLATVEAEQEVACEELPQVLSKEPQRTRYAGVLMLYVAFVALQLWDVFRSQNASCGPVRRFGWRQTVAAVALCFALRFRSIEDTKNAMHEDLGRIIGTGRGPSVDDIRLKLKRLSESVEPTTVTRDLFRRYLALEPVWEAMYYIDGHFLPYYGEETTPKGWDSKRRIAVPGRTDNYVHDVNGRVLFFLSQPLNSSLGRAIPDLVAEIRRVHGDRPFTLVFDRGGYSKAAFRFLTENGIRFITYLKGRKARRRFPAERFRASWFKHENKRHVYRVYEKKTRVNGAGLVRTVVYMSDDGEQIPVLTSVDESHTSAKVVHCLRLRWRQENSFKYLTENYGIDQIIQYGADELDDDRLLPNPKRKELNAKIRAVRGEIVSLEAQLGRALDTNDENTRPTVRGVKIANAKLRRELAKRNQVLARLENRRAHTPANVAEMELNGGSRRSVLREDRRLLVTTLKLVAHNAERMLARQFNRHYRREKDVFSVFRGLLHLGGQLRYRSNTELEVEFDRPKPEKVARALAGFLVELNEKKVRMLGNGPILCFSVRPS